MTALFVRAASCPVPEPAVPAITDPATMSAADRRDEVASILACGLLRCVRLSRSRTSAPPEKVSDSGNIGLELGEHSRLTVVNRPRG